MACSTHFKRALYIEFLYLLFSSRQSKERFWLIACLMKTLLMLKNIFGLVTVLYPDYISGRGQTIQSDLYTRWFRNLKSNKNRFRRRGLGFPLQTEADHQGTSTMPEDGMAQPEGCLQVGPVWEDPKHDKRPFPPTSYCSVRGRTVIFFWRVWCPLP